MRGRENQKWVKALCLGFCCLLLGLVAVTQALAAEEPPYEFSAQLSLTGGCGVSTSDPIADPGCPEKKPPIPFTKPTSIAVDSFGNEYVASYGSEEGKQGRIDVFDPAGVFITEVKDEAGPESVAVDSKGNLYVIDHRSGQPYVFARYSPVKYEPKVGEIEYGARKAIQSDEEGKTGVTVDASNNHVFVSFTGAIGLIKEYGSAEEENKLLGSFTNEKLYSNAFLTVDAKRRRLYISSCPTHDITHCWIIVLNADKPSELLEEVDGSTTVEERFVSSNGWISVAVDENNGDFFVGDLGEAGASNNVYQFNKDYELISTLKLEKPLFGGGEPLQIALSNAPEEIANHTYLFVPSLTNRALAFSPPQVHKPAVEVMVTGIGESEAELKATIRPQGGITTYRFEYLSQQEYEEAGNSFAGAKMAREGTIPLSEQEAHLSAPISGLEPETAYRFRVVAENEGGEAEAESSFATYNDVPVSGGCPNEAVRTAYSALLPDCRAYELVTPPDTNGRRPRGAGITGDGFPNVEVSSDGETVSFLLEGGSLPGLEGTGSFNGDLYRSDRASGGWGTASAGPTGAETMVETPGSTSSDQGYSFWQTSRGSAAIEGKETHYVHYPDGHSALVGRGSLGTEPRAFGKFITKNGTHIVFQTQTPGAKALQLEPEAAPTGTQAVYDRTADEVTHVVSLLPGSVPLEAEENALYVGASSDGEGVAFEVQAPPSSENNGKLFLRLHDETTYEIGKGGQFAGVSEEGKRVFYVEGGDLFAFDVESEENVSFAETGNAVPVGVSADGTRAYFVSTTVIAGSGEEPNPNGDVAQAGQQNLYLSEEGHIRFVATVTKRDVEGEPSTVGKIDGLGLWTLALKNSTLAVDPSRTTPDGKVLLFSSRADLDGYAHEGVPEIYRYDRTGNRLHCVSCIPTKTPAGQGGTLQTFLAAGTLAPLSGAGFVPNLSSDGKRAFFQSTEALVSRDNDQLQDVYEWEEQGEGSCTRAGGCVYLISAGHSARINYLYAMGDSGDDVFFVTNDVLSGFDAGDTASIYDARVGGGFPEPNSIPCQEVDKCRPEAISPPALPGLTSEGLGRLEEGKALALKCPKGKHKIKRNGKEVCVKNKKHHRKSGRTKKGAGK